MRNLRSGLAIVTTLILGGLYAASQLAFWRGPEAAKEYATLVDAPWMRWTALALFVGAIVLMFVRDKEEREHPS